MRLRALSPDIILAVLLLVVYFSNHGMEFGRTKLAAEQLFPRVPGPHVGGEVLLGVGEIAAREGATNLNLVLGIMVLKVRYQGGGTGEGSLTVGKITREIGLGRILLYFQYRGCHGSKLSCRYFFDYLPTVHHRLVQESPPGSYLLGIIDCT